MKEKSRSFMDTKVDLKNYKGYIHFNRAMRWQGYLDFDEIWYGGSLPQNKKPF